MGTLVLGLVVMVIGVIAIAHSVSSNMSPGIGVDVYNYISFVYSALRWGIIGLMLTVLGGIATVIGVVKRKH
jgi:hypothetical protein